ncbi:hypothetical protein CAEBREN_16785 [Caenorhabditis brenneri]|uniref:Fork-head domain-containing protein n=1 Tax=Caenorhabditis brenneri TaxID=135651 RepID=G0PBJ2_CAEBE|nr:hypothetical protein CAEBREN_16785 [Caenorhabditis brenneri]
MSHLVPHCPKFSLGFLAALACINSAIGAVTETEVISFILHHFPYYRFACSSWRNALREAMKTEWRFGHNKTVTGINSVYLWNPGNLEYDEENMEEINNDARGNTEFFELLIKGEIGLPRQLFYDVIGLPAPEFAGPENSAMFYHLLSIGQYPKPFCHFIRIYTTPSIHSEPKFNGASAPKVRPTGELIL